MRPRIRDKALNRVTHLVHALLRQRLALGVFLASRSLAVQLSCSLRHLRPRAPDLILGLWASA